MLLWATMPAAWLMTACQSGTDEPVGSDEMVFTTEGTTRATLVDYATLFATPFAVYGDMYTLTPDADSRHLPVYDGTEVRYDTWKRQWTYDEPRYWFPGFQYSMVALQPAASTSLSDIQYADNKLDFTYTQPADYTHADDLLVATHRRHYTGGKTEAVNLKFHHILSNLSVAVSYLDASASKDARLIVTGLAFKNVSIRGTYSVVPAQVSGGGVMTSDWTYGNGTADGWQITGKGDVELRFPAEGPGSHNNANDETPRPLFSATDALLLLPNPEAGTEVVLTYVVDDGKGVIGSPQTATATLPRGWEAGKNCSLALSIKGTKVNVRFEVAEWETGGSTDMTVPRK